MDFESQWVSARSRMRPYIDAVFRQDLGLAGPDIETSIDWILDKVMKPEYLAACTKKYSLWRQDDNGQMFEMEKNLDYRIASEKLQEFEAKGHKQHYWIAPGQDIL